MKIQEQTIDNLMVFIRDWVHPHSGGMTGELHLTKTWQDGQWVLEMQVVRPVSSWHLGADS